jgi:hypothetical protein
MICEKRFDRHMHVSRDMWISLWIIIIPVPPASPAPPLPNSTGRYTLPCGSLRLSRQVTMAAQPPRPPTPPWEAPLDPSLWVTPTPTTCTTQKGGKLFMGSGIGYYRETRKNILKCLYQDSWFRIQEISFCNGQLHFVPRNHVSHPNKAKATPIIFLVLRARFVKKSERRRE